MLGAGLWRNNIALVQLLGLCPLLAVTTTVVNGLALGLATTAVLTVTNAAVSAMRGVLVTAVRIPLFVLIIASLVTCIDLLTHALLDDLHVVLGLFIPLIVTNCAILAQAETVASRRPLMESVVSGAVSGVGFLAVLVALGALREVFGQGTLFAGLSMLAGDGFEGFALDLPFDGVLAAMLPPGAFFGMAVLLALRNRLSGAKSAAGALEVPVEQLRDLSAAHGGRGVEGARDLHGAQGASRAQRLEGARGARDAPGLPR
jgi:electron transport complex protein RnfE